MISAAQLVDPVEFLQPNRRLFIDTNIFMDTNPRRDGGLKQLFERGKGTILKYQNPIIIPTKVIGELKKQSNLDPSGETEDRAKAIQKAGTSLVFLESASKVGLVRTDLGDETNPYADDLFLRLFERFANTYEMCLLTHDITIKLRIRLLAHKLSKRLLVGVLTKDGDLELDSDQGLLDRGQRKFERHRRHLVEESGTFKDESEVVTLKPLLEQFERAFKLTASPVSLGPRSASPLRAKSSTTVAAPIATFPTHRRVRTDDTPLPVSDLPDAGEEVHWRSASQSGTIRLGSLLGEGGEGSVFEGDRESVIKIFDRDHVTSHRRKKISLLVEHDIQSKGACIPSALISNASGEFVGYMMPRASGREFQRTIFNKRKFAKEFPNWKKVDLVDICISFLTQVRDLHAMNIILGDINPKNLMVDEKKNVFIIDADSWQLDGYPCPVGTPMFTSPRMLGTAYSDKLRTMEDELFAVATMLFMIIMTGQFPYVRTGTDGDIVQLIKEGNFAFQYENRNNKDQPEGDWKYMWSHIHKPVKDLFWHTFHKEGKRYKRRPSATEWLEAFSDYRAYLVNKRLNFDPMSNDVYPIRNKAFRPDTPIQDCPRCGRKHAIAGIWNDDSATYFIPGSCNKCKTEQSRIIGSTRGSPTASPSRRAQPPSVTLTARCKDCGKGFPKSQLTWGRCPGCAAKSKMFDPNLLCADCRQPFITYDHKGWFSSRSLELPKSHSAIKQNCPPHGSNTPIATRPSAQAQSSWWERFKKWFLGN